MKKVFPILLTIMLIIVCCSCDQSVKIPEVTAAIDNDAEITCGGTNYSCHITYVNAETASVRFDSPDSLRGMTFRRADGKYTVSLGGMICKSESASLSNGNISGEAIKLLDSIKSDKISFTAVSEDKTCEFLGKNGSESFKLFTDINGKIKSIKSDKINIKIKN